MSDSSSVTKTEARKEAASVLSHGYFRPGHAGASAYVRCRRCRRDVTVEFVAWAKEREICDLLRTALANHIYEGCDQ